MKVNSDNFIRTCRLLSINWLKHSCPYYRRGSCFVIRAHFLRLFTGHPHQIVELHLIVSRTCARQDPLNITAIEHVSRSVLVKVHSSLGLWFYCFIRSRTIG